jgi:hypothetical protein
MHSAHRHGELAGILDLDPQLLARDGAHGAEGDIAIVQENGLVNADRFGHGGAPLLLEK